MTTRSHGDHHLETRSTETLAVNGNLDQAPARSQESSSGTPAPYFLRPESCFHAKYRFLGVSGSALDIVYTDTCKAATTTSQRTIFSIVILPWLKRGCYDLGFRLAKTPRSAVQLEKLRVVHLSEKKEAMAEFRAFKRMVKEREEITQVLCVDYLHKLYGASSTPTFRLRAFD